jgi:hypothetical protein
MRARARSGGGEERAQLVTVQAEARRVAADLRAAHAVDGRARDDALIDGVAVKALQRAQATCCAARDR